MFLTLGNNTSQGLSFARKKNFLANLVQKLSRYINYKPQLRKCLLFKSENQIILELRSPTYIFM